MCGKLNKINNIVSCEDNKTAKDNKTGQKRVKSQHYALLTFMNSDGNMTVTSMINLLFPVEEFH